MIAPIMRHAGEVSREMRYLLTGSYPAFVTDRNPAWTGDEVPVFVYHSVEPKEFAGEMEYLARNGYSTITVGELLSFLEWGIRPAQRPVMLTFDDGYASVWTEGGPILKKHGFVGVAFIVPDWIGRPGYLSWDEVRAMQESRMFDVQSHGLSHRIMQGAGEPDLKGIRYELVESKRVIEEQLPGHRVQDYCFPRAEGSEEAVLIARETGFRTAFWGVMNGRAVNRKGDSPYHIARLKHDFLVRLPGKNRKSMASVMWGKSIRRLKGQPYA
ncbi:MAG: polysaccharide deacetylase family protein [Candidatus Omnitrophica bacterium]|nr:polysaccharide deacetylase family protein [Candidatus Omnitrophota bacterium]